MKNRKYYWKPLCISDFMFERYCLFTITPGFTQISSFDSRSDTFWYYDLTAKPVLGEEIIILWGEYSPCANILVSASSKSHMNFETVAQHVVIFIMNHQYQLDILCNYQKISYCNHNGAEISVIWLVERRAIKLLILYVTREKQTLRSREISRLILHWQHFWRSVLGLCFLASKKEDNTVKLIQYIEIFCGSFLQRDAFRPYWEWNKLMINQ